MKITVRNETAADFRIVEEITREAFWNHHVPGCDEHFLVHRMRNHPDFIPELDFVALADGRIVGNIMYAKSYLLNELGERRDALTFGPVSVLPEYQRKGVGSALIRESVAKAREMGYDMVLIYGFPHNYCSHGFKASRDYNIGDEAGKYPCGLLALEMKSTKLNEHRWRFHISGLYHIDEAAASEFDRQFPEKKKERTPAQEAFSIMCRAYLE
jgi:putative acetyltransferase